MFYRWVEKDLIVTCRIQTLANEDCFADVFNDALKIRLTALPIEGKANRQLVKFLSKQFKVPQDEISIMQGRNSRMKKIRISAPGRLPQELKIAGP